MPRQYIRVPLSERFAARTIRNPGDGCWLWSGSPSTGGYGKISVFPGAIAYSHRVAWELATGETLTSADLICHTCDVRLCVRNDEVGVYEVGGVTYERRGHLFKATLTANSLDAQTKGRLATGHRHGSRTMPERLARGDASGARRHPECLPRGDRNGSRLHPESVVRGEDSTQSRLTNELVIAIRAEARKGDSQRVLARRYGVGQTTIGHALRRETWAHVDESGA